MSKHAAATTPAQLLTVQQAASRLALSVRKVWTLIADGTLTPYRFGARATRVAAKDVAALIDAARQDGR